MINFQMGEYPVGTNYEVPGLRENLYGKFTVNLGVFIPGVNELRGLGAPGKVVREHSCSVRARLGELAQIGSDIWWNLDADLDVVADDVIQLLLHHGLPFLDRFAEPSAVASDWVAFSEGRVFHSDSRLVAAVVAVELGDPELASRWIHEQLARANEHHRPHVLRLAQRIGVETSG